jgi:ATPase subunit of ABC transporter with duplicated ATPase domains
MAWHPPPSPSGWASACSSPGLRAAVRALYFDFHLAKAPALQVEVSRLTIRLDGRPILRDLDFSVVGEQAVAVVGPFFWTT